MMRDEKHESSVRDILYHGWFEKRIMTEDQNKKLRMLRPLNDACMECTMCRLGRQEHIHNGNKIEQPHVFSNMNPSKYVIVGQNPGYNECVRGEPFVGDAGSNFDLEIEKNGLTRNTFYITNSLKCHTPENRKPEVDELEACEPFLAMELKLLKPLIVVALGAAAFEILCPNKVFSESLGKITQSKFNVKVFATYHPSPRNMVDQSRKAKFEKDIATLCALIRRIEAEAVHKDAAENIV